MSGQNQSGGGRSGKPRRDTGGSGKGGASGSGGKGGAAGRSGKPARGGSSGGRGAGGYGGARRTVPGAPRRQARPPKPASAPVPSSSVHDPDGVRLQKVLAQAGVASRRASEELILAGRVEVDGEIVRELGVRVDPTRRAISVDGLRLQLDTAKVYLALNKPVGVVTTMADPEGRPCIGDLVASRTDRLFHVGRLDVDTEGLILLTNDGDFAHRLQHPSYEVPKTYLAEIPGPVPRDLGKRLRAGIELEDGLAQVDSFRMLDSAPGRALVELVLHEGRNHIVRRMLKEAGHPVIRLVRTQIGPVLLGDLLPGRNRVLTSDELGTLLSRLGL